jgi:hypothetical protein
MIGLKKSITKNDTKKKNNNWKAKGGINPPGLIRQTHESGHEIMIIL